VLLATTLLSGLAAGALSCLLALAIKADPGWLSLPFALGIGAFMRWQGYRGVGGSVAAAAAVLICLIYAQYLYAAVRMADMLGFPLRDTLFKMDWHLAWQIVAANLGAWDMVVFAISPLLAAGVAARWRR
jgi:hypothetical protein